MASVYFTEEHEIFRKSVSDFMKKEVRPYADEWEDQEEFPRDMFKRLGDLGFLGISYPEDCGGSNADYFTNVVFAEELGKCDSSGFSTSVSVHKDMASPAIDYFGTHEQKQKFLAPVITGDTIAALGVTEPNHGSDVASLETSAVKDGDEYVINGTKMFITNGARADTINLAVRTGGEGYTGISLILVETKTPGFSVGQKLKKMGVAASDTAELIFEECRVPAENMLGDEGSGFYGIMAGFENERIISAVLAYAGAERGLELVLDYAKQRTQFGRPIGKFQAISHMIADTATEIEAAKQMTYHAAWLHAREEPCIKEVHMAKLYAAEMANRAAYNAVQIFGGYGYMKEYKIERFYRDARLINIAAGTSQIMKNVLAKQFGL